MQHLFISIVMNFGLGVETELFSNVLIFMTSVLGEGFYPACVILLPPPIMCIMQGSLH